MSGGSAEARGAPPGRTHPPGWAIVDLDIQGQWTAGLAREPEDPGTGSPPRWHPHTPAMGRALTLSLRLHRRAPGLQKAESDGVDTALPGSAPLSGRGLLSCPGPWHGPRPGATGMRRKVPGWFSSRESTCSAGASRDMGSTPGSGRSPGGGHGCPLQYSCLENPMDRGAWRATAHGLVKSQTRLKRLSTHKVALRIAPGSHGTQAS